MEKHFLAVWDMYGLESIHDVSKELVLHEEWKKTKMWNELQDIETPPWKGTIPLHQMLYRAKFNSHRRYEIYEFTSTMAIHEIIQLFNEDAQSIVEWIRRNGYKVYSDYSNSNIKIT